MTSRQHDPPMVHLGLRRSRRLANTQARALNQRPAASRAPIPNHLFPNHRMALAAHLFHTQKLTGSPAHPASHCQPARYTKLMHPPVRLVAIDMDGTLLPNSVLPSGAPAVSRRNAQALRAAQAAGITVAIATGRRMAYTVPLLESLGLRADTPLITSNGAVIRTLDGQLLDRCHLDARVARALCGLLRPFGAVVFTFDRPGRSELVLEDLEQAHGRIALWVETNRNAIEVIQPLEHAFDDGDDPIQGMVTGYVNKMKEAERALKASEWSDSCECVRTEYPARDVCILDLLPRASPKAGPSSNSPPASVFSAVRPWPSATTGTTSTCSNGQDRLSSWATPPWSCAPWQRRVVGSKPRTTTKTA